MDHGIEVSEFHLGTETPSAFHLLTFTIIGEENIAQPTKWNKTKQNQKDTYEVHFLEDWRETL